jgi:hypothetical protein
MNCPEEQFLEEFLQGEASANDGAAFQQHLESCAPCRLRLEKERQFDGLLRTVPLLKAPAELRQQVLAALQNVRHGFSLPDRLWVIGLALVCAGVGALVGWGGAGFIRGLYSKLSQWAGHFSALDSIRGLPSSAQPDWPSWLSAGNSILLLNFLIAGIILCWGLWQMVRVLRR